MTFWIITGALAVACAAMLALALFRQRPEAEPAAAYDLRVYRDQLKDVDRDLARGVIDRADAERIRAEISRRILAADAALRASKGGASGPRLASVAAGLAAGALLIGGSLMLYLDLGAPGYGDLALADRIEMAEDARLNRPSQEEAEAGVPPSPSLQEPSPDYAALMERLRETVARRPGDLQGHMLLARNEAALGNFKAAYEAQETVLRLKGEEATAGDFTDLADMLIIAAGGYVSPEAERALTAALERDPGYGPARYYVGLMMGQTGRPDITFRIWQDLLQRGPADAPWIAPIRAQIEDVAARAGVEYSLPPEPQGQAPRGPSAADIEAAGDMSAEERAGMIRAMVQGLSDRLADEGGPPADWARLIGALGVLGEAEQARAIYENAQEVFSGDEGALQTVRNAARQAGIAE